jgi:hypothetical protein
MKPLFLLFLIPCILIFPRVFGQQSVIAVAYQNTVFTGIKNVIHIAVSEYPVSAIQAEPSMGLLEKTGTPGEYIWRICKRAGPATIKLYVVKKGIKTFVAEHAFRVRRLPDPEVGVPYNHRSFAVVTLGGPLARTLDVDYDALWHIKSFDIEMYRKKGDTIVLKNNGPYFTEENGHYLYRLGDGDKYRLTNIVAYIDCDMERTNLSTRVYEIFSVKPRPAAADTVKEAQRMRK